MNIFVNLCKNWDAFWKGEPVVSSGDVELSTGNHDPPAVLSAMSLEFAD